MIWSLSSVICYCALLNLLIRSISLFILFYFFVCLPQLLAYLISCLLCVFVFFFHFLFHIFFLLEIILKIVLLVICALCLNMDCLFM